jgi:hypothetical protein
MINDLERSDKLERSDDVEKSRDLDKGEKSYGSSKSSYSCATCSQSFNSRQELKEHSSTQH